MFNIHQLKSLALTAALALAGVGTAMADNQILFSLGEAEGQTGTSGKKAETVDVCMKLQNPALEGLQIKAVRIAFAETDGISNATAWLSQQLPAIKSTKAQAPDICSQPFEVSKDYTEVTFETPVTIPAEGLYVGYSFDMAASDAAAREPILVTGNSTPEAFIIHSTKIFRTAWQDRYQKDGQLAIQVVLTGESVKQNAAAVVSLPVLNTQTGETSDLIFTVENHGAAGIQQLDYTISIDGQDAVSGTATCDVAPIFGATTAVQVTLPAMEQKGNKPYSVTITQVNGQPNEDIAPTATAEMHTYNVLPKHRPVLEEYTGTWCGYCPRGFVGLEEMNRLFPEDFIGISYHNDDPMAITNDYPSPVEGFPDAWLDRWYQTDAFCGDEAYGTFGIDKAWQYVSSIFAPAVVDVESSWSSDDKLSATAAITFPIGSDECHYTVGFALVANGLSGTGSSWRQSNYYNGDNSWPASMDLFTKGGSKIDGLVFNDVVIECSTDRGIEGSLTAPIEADVAQTVTHDFDLSAISSAIVPEDRSQLHVVAMVIDTQTGRIVNANKAQAGTGTATTIQRPATTAGEVTKQIRHTDLSGRHVSTPRHGIFLRTVTRQDGTVSTQKVLIP